MSYKIEENRRLLAVDDDFLILKLYERLFSGSTHVEEDEPPQLIDQLERLVVEEESAEEPLNSAVRAPYELHTETQGQDAVNAVIESIRKQKPFSVALIDMRMPPGIDGMETAQRIRALDPHIQILFVTAYSDHGIDQVDRLVGGQVLWFNKPFESEVLYQTVRNCCWSWNQSDQLRSLQDNLTERVNLQTRRLHEQLQAGSLLQSECQAREIAMHEIKRENRTLHAYQELRLLLSQPQLPTPKSAKPLLDEPENQLNALLISSSAEVVERYRTPLQEIAFQVMVADSLSTALDQTMVMLPDIALIDVELGSEEAATLIQRLQDDYRSSRVIALLLTRKGDELQAIRIGATYWMEPEQPIERFQQKMGLIRDYLLYREEEAVSAVLAAEKQLEEAEVNNRRILLVDDEVANTRILEDILLKSKGGNSVENELKELVGSFSVGDDPADTPVNEENLFELTAAHQGEEAVELALKAQINELPFAVALIDMRMPPGIDGLETARQIRQISPEMDIVILTAFSDYSLNDIQQVLGFNFTFMHKPYKPEEILQRVTEGCAKWVTSHKLKRAHCAVINIAEDMEQEIILRKETEMALEQANRTKDEFLSSMSHELRTPLTTMIGYSEILMEEQGLQSRHREMVESSLLAGKTLLQLVNDVLDMSKIRSGKFELNPAPYDLHRAISDIAQLMQVYGSQRGVSIVLTLDEAVVPLLDQQWIGDEMRISQILFNLLSNAVKFSEGRGEVHFRLQLDQRARRPLPGVTWFEIQVEDQGIGMSEAVQQRLFTPFEQADSTTSRRFGGTGLGLYICKQLVEMMSGEIQVQSREGRGSLFIVSIPLKRSEQLVEKRSSAAQRSGEIPQLQGEVLLAEDTFQLQRLATVLLEKSGVNVAIANNGVEALEMGLQHPYDLILMDMQMPKMDGIEATRRLRNEGCGSPIVALTANVMPHHREMFERAGCDAFLSKPIRRSALYQTMERFLAVVEPTTADPQQDQYCAATESGVVEDEDLSAYIDEEMLQEFHDYMQQEAKVELLQAWEQGDWEQLRRTAHAIKGMGASYGFQQMSTLAATLQEHALKGERAQLEAPYSALVELIDEVAGTP